MLICLSVTAGLLSSSHRISHKKLLSTRFTLLRDPPQAQRGGCGCHFSFIFINMQLFVYLCTQARLCVLNCAAAFVSAENPGRCCPIHTKNEASFAITNLNVFTEHFLFHRICVFRYTRGISLVGEFLLGDVLCDVQCKKV